MGNRPDGRGSDRAFPRSPCRAGCHRATAPSGVNGDNVAEMGAPAWLVSAAFQLFRFLPERWTRWRIKVHFGQPSQGASANTDPLLSWWHVPVSLRSRSELKDCRIFLTLN